MATNTTYLGSAQTFTGIPRLLISDLARVEDPVVQRALLQIQNYANSIGELHAPVIGTATAALGVNNCPAIFPGSVAFWCQVSYRANKAWIPVWV